MKDALAQLNSLISAWEKLCVSRPAVEHDFKPAGYPGLKAEHITKIFAGWYETLDLAVKKTQKTENIEEHLLEAVLIKTFQELTNHVQSARSNGFNWLLQGTPILVLINDAAIWLTFPIERRAAVRKGMIKLAESKLNDDILDVQKAAPLAKEITALHEKIQADNEVITTAKESIDANALAVSEAKEETTETLGQVSSLLTEAKESKSEIDDLKVSLTEVYETATEKLAEINDLLEQTGVAIGEGQKQVTIANERLAKALQDINRQELAGAFHSQAENVSSERFKWLIAFGVSIVAIVVVAWCVLGVPSPETKGVDYLQRLLAGLPFLGPLVWFGWYAGREAGALGKVKQDYEYKAATAVAFEGHKKEVADSGDEALSQQLLETAIKNFGDNPLRLRSGKESNHAMPLEALIEAAKDEKWYDRALELLKLARSGSRG